MAKEKEISVPLSEFVKQIAEHAGKEGAKCVIRELKIEGRMNGMERRITGIRIRLAWILGLMVGGGMLGGGITSLIAKYF